MTFKIFRRGSAKYVGLLAAFVTILLCLYYISIGQPSNSNKEYKRHNEALHRRSNIDNGTKLSWSDSGFHLFKKIYNNKQSSNNIHWETCPILETQLTDITSIDEYSKFDFQPEWMKNKEYWDKSFESRYEVYRKDTKLQPLKIFIVPHSHNDPGWLKTFINYFQSDSRQILNLIIVKMQEYKDMTFIWSEISILQLWWDQAHPTKQRALKKLIDSGRFEITTGGWVMTDEANVHVYAMLDQLIEGHQWVKTNLNYTPITGWSIDPFGHGSTVPYLLAASGFEGTIIQRIHYAWKQWFAKHQAGDFLWKPYWKTVNHQKHQQHYYKNEILTHNMPFDIYSIKHSCGPHPYICLNFDFRKIPGEYTEYSIKAQFITDDNVAAKADLLMDQYARTASLFPHNVILVPIGDDFRYNKEKEVEQQYYNYKKLIDYINKNKIRYKGAEIKFGLPKDYFAEIRKRNRNNFPTFKGDFFVYSDIFTEGRPAYWSGYFTTRPLYKILSRDLEHNLRSLEILFTISFNYAKQNQYFNALRIFEKNYEKLIIARRNLGLFQHHDAITGTSKANVMRDYGIRLFESIQDVIKLQESTIELLLQKNPQFHYPKFILSELERENYIKLPHKSPIIINQLSKEDQSEFIVYNSLVQERYEFILIRTLMPNVKVINSATGQLMNIQINPVWNLTENSIDFNNGAVGGINGVINRITVSDQQFEIIFLAKLPPLSIVTFKIEYDQNYTVNTATLYCNDCKGEKNDIFIVKNKQPGDIQLENNKMRLLFDEQSGFLKTITRKNIGKSIQCAIKFGAYHSAQFHSGAYLFKTDTEHSTDGEKDILEQYSNEIKILITSGPIASDVTVIYGGFLAHTVRLFNSGTIMDGAIFIENDIDFEPPPKNRETELFMRFITDIENGDTPEFYSDLNGFQYQKRIKLSRIGIEGNYFPITSGAFIQDDKMRMTILTNHAQGAASYENGQLEIMIDRRTLYDDYRGMGEGVVDSKMTRHRHWLLFEEFNSNNNDINNNNNNEYQVLSLFGNQLANSINYPVNIYYIENLDENYKLNLLKNVTLLTSHIFPCDLHLLTLRTQTEENLPLFPSHNSFLVLHRQGSNCNFKNDYPKEFCSSPSMSNKNEYDFNKLFNYVKINKIFSTSLTGLKTNDIITDFSKVYIKPMEIQTFNISFVN